MTPHNNFSISKIFALVTLIVIAIASVYVFFGQNSFHFSPNLETIFHRDHFALNPLSHFGAFRSETGNFFFFEHYQLNSGIPKAFLFLLLGLFLPMFLHENYTASKILAIGGSIAFLISFLQIIVIAIAFGLQYRYNGVFSTGEILANFVAFCVGFGLYSILPKNKNL